ncbi:MAG: glycosyltransferase family 2 protein [Janthinobacterium lividum]
MTAEPVRSGLQVAVVLASAGRPTLLEQAVRYCVEQQGQPFTGVVSVPDEASLPEDRSLLEGWTVVTGTRGLSAQRNAGLDAVPDADLVAFFDDDAVIRPDYLTRAVEFFEEHPEVVGITGRVLADGAVSGEISEEEAQRLVAASVGPVTRTWARTRELYGCNFVVRTSDGSRLRFDDRLPLYSWLEDHDYARRLMRRGALAHVEDCVIVHRAASSGGRQAHTRLGYSQVMNPVYLSSKGSFPVWLTVQQVFRPVAKNVALSVRGPASGWRRERLRGNLLAARDIVSGRISPERAAKL